MPKTEEKWRSVRKALSEISNNHGGGGGGGGRGRFSKSFATAKKKEKEARKLRVQEHDKEEKDHQNDDALDRLLLVQSDLSALTHQGFVNLSECVICVEIDCRLMNWLQAFKCQGKATKEVKSFPNFLSKMLSSLKPWMPKFQKALFYPVESAADEGESVEIASPQDSLISHSPLVSWRTDCTIERGRHLLKLTPLPISKSLSSRPPVPSRSSVFERMTSCTVDRIPKFHATFGDANDSPELVAAKPTPIKPSDSVTEAGSNLKSGFVSPPPMFPKQGGSMVVNMMTPCLKMSPPKSCVLLEPFSESSPKVHHGVHKSTPFLVGFTYCSDSSGSESSGDLAFRYPELKNHVESSPEWCISPPKTCVLLDPHDEKSPNNANIDSQLLITGHLLDNHINFSISKEDDGQGGIHPIKTSSLYKFAGGSFAMIESTPIWKEAESVVRVGKYPGENTLKQELWTKFEAASINGVRFNDTATHKGFLDRLDEVVDGD
ncbi:unnamed protein product [Malus baccata var. baccata]